LEKLRSLNITWLILAGTIVVLTNGFPIYQILFTDAPLFYSNAYDEAYYLTYESSVISQSVGRTGQYIVTALHRLGFSGGAINLLFDFICPLAILILTRKIFMMSGISKKGSSWAAFLIFTLPILLGTSNTYYSRLFSWNLSSGWIYWITMPEAYFSPFVRTPEPQFSWLLLVAAIYLALKKKSFLPMYAVLPFLYVFISVPAGFIVLTLHLLQWNKKNNRIKTFYAAPVIGILVFIGISLSIAVFRFLLGPESILANSLVSSRLPLFSLTALVAIVICSLGFKKIQTKFQPIALIVGFSPLVAANTQIISGYITQPNNFEQGFGTVVFSFLIALISISAKAPSYFIKGVRFLGLALLIVNSIKVFSVNSHPQFREKFPPELLKTLKSHPHRVVFDNLSLASAASLIYPQQKMSALSYAQMLSINKDSNLRNYLCLKRFLQNNEDLRARFSKLIKTLDHEHKYLSRDFILTHINRKKEFKVYNNSDDIPANCPRTNYIVPNYQTRQP